MHLRVKSTDHWLESIVLTQVILKKNKDYRDNGRISIIIVN